MRVREKTVEIVTERGIVKGRDLDREAEKEEVKMK